MHMMYEALARERMREDQRRAAHRRQVDRLVAQRRWRRVARFAQTRAERLDLCPRGRSRDTSRVRPSVGWTCLGCVRGRGQL
jgi:hypothetical protein